MGRPSKSVDIRLTHNKWNGRTVCGAFRPKKKAEFIEKGLTVENLLEDEKLFREYICCKNPAVSGKNLNRCRFHGAGGRPPLHGKYVNLPTFTDEQIKNVFDREHKDLTEELSILSHFIEVKLGDALNQEEFTNVVKGKVKEEIRKFVQAYKDMKVEVCLAVATKLEKMLDAADNQASAKSEVRQLIKEYGDLFKIEIVKRQATGEYISKQLVIVQYISIIDAILPYIPDEQRELARTAALSIIRRGDEQQTKEESAGSFVMQSNGP